MLPGAGLLNGVSSKRDPQSLTTLNEVAYEIEFIHLLSTLDEPELKLNRPAALVLSSIGSSKEGDRSKRHHTSTTALPH